MSGMDPAADILNYLFYTQTNMLLYQICTCNQNGFTPLYTIFALNLNVMEDGRVKLVTEFQAVVLLSCKSQRTIDLEGCLLD